MPNVDEECMNNLININKKTILSLFRWHSENNEENFKMVGYEICKIFDENGDYELSEYIQAQLSEKNTWSPQKSNKCTTYIKIKEKLNNLNIKQWIPKPPGDGFFLGTIYETEDGPVVLWMKSICAK